MEEPAGFNLAALLGLGLDELGELQGGSEDTIVGRDVSVGVKSIGRSKVAELLELVVGKATVLGSLLGSSLGLVLCGVVTDSNVAGNEDR